MDIRIFKAYMESAGAAATWQGLREFNILWKDAYTIYFKIKGDVKND